MKVNRQKPWINQHIFGSIRKKRGLWDAYVKSRTEENYERYKSANNSLKHLITEARKRYESEIASSSGRSFYTYVNRTLSSRIGGFALRDVSTGGVFHDSAAVSEMFARQFEGVFAAEPDGVLPSLPDSTRLQETLDTISFTPEKVHDAINSLRDNASPGVDDIPPVFLKRCSDTLSAPLAAAMTEALTTGCAPHVWTQAVVTPIYKKGDRYMPENFRPISLTSTLSKCMEKIIVRELTDFLLRNNVIPTSQHGFLPGRSIDTNLLSCLNDWTLCQDSGQPVDVIYLDFEKAFDRVPFKRLLYKLEHYGVRGKLLSWITGFLTKREFQVRVGGALSNKRAVRSGVPQGSVLGPLLFLLYVSDMPDCVQSNVCSFADDTKIYSCPFEAGGVLQEDLFRVESWCDTWLMSLNANKCAVLHIGANNPNHNYILKGVQLAAVKQQRDLGVVIASDLKWEGHIARIVKRANTFIYLILKAFKDHSSGTVIRLYKTYLRPSLEFAASSWSPYFAKDIELIERVQRRITRIPPELKTLSYEDRCSRLNLTTLRERRQRGDLIQTYKILSGYYTVSLDILRNSDQGHLRGHSKKLCKEKCSRLCRRNFLSNRVVYVWNTLDQGTVDAPSVNIFKNRLDANLGSINREFVHYCL